MSCFLPTEERRYFVTGCIKAPFGIGRRGKDKSGGGYRARVDRSKLLPKRRGTISPMVQLAPEFLFPQCRFFPAVKFAFNERTDGRCLRISASGRFARQHFPHLLQELEGGERLLDEIH